MENIALPTDLTTVKLTFDTPVVTLFDVVKGSGLATSTFDANRFFRGGAVRLDGEQVLNPEHNIVHGTNAVLEIGKRRRCRVVVEIVKAR